MQAQSIRLNANPDLDGVFETIRAAGAGAVLILDEPIPIFHRKKIADLAQARRIPTLFPRDYVDAGGVLNYSTSVFDAVARMPAYLHRIFKGDKPADLPIQIVKDYQLIVNLKAAAQIGLNIPPDILKRADRVIPASP